MYTFTKLEEDTPYVFYVSAETSAGEGEAAMVMGRTSEDGECVSQCVPMIVESICPSTHVINMPFSFSLLSPASSSICCTRVQCHSCYCH